MKKEKTVRTYQRRTKSGKIVTVRQHTAKYDAAERAKDSSKRKGAGEELEKVKTKKALQKADLFDGYDFSEEDFNEWYEGTGSANDKKVAKALRKTLGRKAYNELSDLAADNYKKGGASSFFKKNVHSKTAETKTSNRTKKGAAKTEKENDYTIVKGPGMMGGEFAVKDGKAYTRDVTKKRPKWKPMKEWSSTAQKVLEYYEALQDTSMPLFKVKRKTSTKTSSANAKVSKPKEEYRAYKKLMDEKQKTGKRLSITETTKLKKLAKAAGVGRFIE